MIAAVAEGDEPDAGIVPDIAAAEDFEAAAAGVDVDVEMRRALEVLAQWRDAKVAGLR